MSSPANFADRLMDAVARTQAPVCVGIDPQLKQLPPRIRQEFGLDGIDETGPLEASARQAATAAIVAHGRGVIEAVAPAVPAVKINIAFFEPFFDEGLKAYHQLVRDARDAGLLVIGDIKRADIGHTSERYAAAHLGSTDGIHRGGEFASPDAITISPYFGHDSAQPFIDRAKAHGQGVFVLVQTSNPSAVEVQGLRLADGSTLADHVATLVDKWAGESGLSGRNGYSCIGAVVAPRDRESTIRIRVLMSRCIFLVPGFGAQGLTASDVAACFKPDGTGAIVNASRSVIYAHDNARYHVDCADDWKRCVATACQDFVASIRAVLPQ